MSPAGMSASGARAEAGSGGIAGGDGSAGSAQPSAAAGSSGGGAGASVAAGSGGMTGAAGSAGMSGAGAAGRPSTPVHTGAGPAQTKPSGYAQATTGGGNRTAQKVASLQALQAAIDA